MSLQNMFDFLFVFVEFLGNAWHTLNTPISTMTAGLELSWLASPLLGALVTIFDQLTLLQAVFGGGFVLIIVLLLIKNLVPLT